MDLAFTEEQDLLRETIRSLLQKYSSPEIVRELEDTDPGYRTDLWEELARQGLLGLTIPEADGGSGMTQLEQVILYEEFGRALTSSPHFVSCVLGARPGAAALVTTALGIRAQCQPDPSAAWARPAVTPAARPRWCTGPAAYPHVPGPQPRSRSRWPRIRPAGVRPPCRPSRRTRRAGARPDCGPGRPR